MGRKDNKSDNSSIERERIMYESQPNSRLNSRNRSSVVRSKIEPLRKSPVLINVKKLDQLNPHSFSGNQDVFKVEFYFIANILGKHFQK